MKKAFLIFILILSMLLSSCGSTHPQSGKDTDTDPGDFDENTEEITPPETEKVPQNEKITVVCDEEYTEEIDEEYLNTDVPVTHHKIRIPKLTLESENAKKFNEKITKLHSKDAKNALMWKAEKNVAYDIDYIFEEYNGIIGILITDFTAVIGSHKNANYYGFYFDTVNDRELDFFEYLEALGVDYSALISAVNSSITEYYPDESFVLKEKLSDYEITAAIFSDNKAYISLPSYGWGKVLGEYEQRFVEQTDKKYDVSIEDKLEIFYNDYKWLIDASPEGDIADAFIVDYNGDGVPELVVDYCNPILHGDFFRVFGIGNNSFEYRGSASYGIGIGCEAEYYFLLYDGKMIEINIETWYSPFEEGDYEERVYLINSECETIKGLYTTCLVSENNFTYQTEINGEYIKSTKKECDDMIDEYRNFAEKYKVSGITHGFRGPWELQKSMLGK